VSRDILVIADTQVTKDSNLEHLRSLARYIIKHRPAHIVHIGDNWDFESLSFYASPLESEGRRLADDLAAGFVALNIITDAINEMNAKQKKKKYKPTLNFIAGNHEERLFRMEAKNPHLSGLVDLVGGIEVSGWTFNKYLMPLWLDGIAFNHYMPNPESGKPIGGGIENKLNKHQHSFVHGHQQKYQYGRRQTMNGQPHFGVCAGAFYINDEAYRGAYNTEIRGFVHMKNFTNRYGFSDYDVDFVSLERLMEKYHV